MTLSAAAIERELIAAAAELHLVASDWDATRRGIDDSKRGIPAARYDASHSGYRPDDGRPDNDPSGPDPIAKADEAERAEIAACQAADALRRAVRTLLDIRSTYRRPGLPRDHEDRVATKEERRQADAETSTLDDVMTCVSCIRKGHEALRYRGRLCRWCYDITQANIARWPQATMPPIDLVTEHIEDDRQGKVRLSAERVERSFRLCYGTPRKFTEEPAPGTVSAKARPTVYG